jgi:hypothetical protein
LGAQVLRYWLAREKAAVERVSSPSDFFLVTAPHSASPTETVSLASETVAAGSRMTSAFIVVVPAASPAMLARTLRELLAETGS